MTKRRSSWRGVKLNATDILHSRVVRTRDGFRCRWSGIPDHPDPFIRRRCVRSRAGGWQMDCAHVFSRRFHGTRWLPLAGITLCKVHHDWAEAHATEWEAFCRRELGDGEYDRLLVLAKGPVGRKPDEKIVRVALRAELKRLETGGPVLAIGQR